MILDEAKLHLVEIYEICEAHGILSTTYTKRISKFLDDFTNWKPEIHILMKDCEIKKISSNAMTHVSIFDCNVEKIRANEDEEHYEMIFTEWKEYLEDGIKKGLIRHVY